MNKKVLIIGAGTAGLAAAVKLQTLGYHVEIFEKEEKVGGRMFQIEEKSFKFDVGPTIVMMPDIYNDVFKFAKRNPNDYLEIQKLDPMYSIHFSDGSKLEASTDLTKLIKELEEISPDEAQGYLAYLADVYKRYLIAKDNLIDISYRRPRDFFNFNSLKAAYKLKTLNSAYSSISRFVKNDKLRKALAFQTLYIGISPYTGPSIYTIIPMIELLYGVWYFKGGMYSMAKAMEKLFLELGGKIHLKSNVEEIVIENKKVKGLKVNNQLIDSEIVLCNADFPYAMKHLIKNEKNKGKYTTKKIDNMEYSSSSYMLYIGLDKKYPKMNVHNIRFAKDFNKNIDDIFENRIPDDPSIYMYSPSKIDDTLAPIGKDVLYVLVPVPNLQNGITWTEEVSRNYRDKIIDMISKIEGFEDIKDHIEVCRIFTPNDFRTKFNLYNGATFGLKPTLFQSSYFRPQNKFMKVEGLYFAGSSNHPGAGVPIVLTSAKLAVQEIDKDMRASK